MIDEDLKSKYEVSSMDLKELKEDKRIYEENIDELEYILSHKDLFKKVSGSIETRLKVSKYIKHKMIRAFSLNSFFNDCEESLRICNIELKYINDCINKLSDSFFAKADDFGEYLSTLFDNVFADKYIFLEVDFIIDHFINMRLNQNYFKITLEYGNIENLEDLKKVERNIKILIDNADAIKEYIIKEFKITDIKL